MATIGTTDGTGGGWITSSGVNDGASVAKAGNADTTTGPITNSVTLISMADDFGASVGSKVIANDGTGAATTDRVGVAKALSGGTLAYNSTATQWIIRGGGATTKLSNVAYAGFATPGADFNGAVRDNIHEAGQTYRLGTEGGEFDVLARPSTQITPNFTKGAGAGSAQFNHTTVGGSGTSNVDNAAAPTRAVPGELTYHYGGLAAPTTDEYKAKDVFES